MDSETACRIAFKSKSTFEVVAFGIFNLKAMNFDLKYSSLVLVSIFFIASVRAMPDDGCWHPCPHIYDPICAADGDATQVFGNKCIMDVHNVCFETGELVIV